MSKDLFLPALNSKSLSCLLLLMINMIMSSCISVKNDVSILIVEPPVSRINMEDIAAQLQKILEGTGMKNVKIVRTGPSQSDQRHMSGWFHDPNHDSEKRWRNLRGEDGTVWDYVIILESPEVIENFPGWYAQGVHDIANEVEKGKAEAVLFMQWPNPYSKAGLDYYREVAYRTGRGRGLKVIPAALAVKTRGREKEFSAADRAYIAAASIYSRLWKKSAGESSYSYNGALAKSVFKTVTENMESRQYTGPFTKAPYGIHTIKGSQKRVIRIINDGHNSRGWPVENGINSMTKDLIEESGLIYRTLAGELSGPRLPKEVVQNDTPDLHYRHFWYLRPPDIRNTKAEIYMPFAFIDDGDRVPPQFKADFVKLEYRSHAYFLAGKWLAGDKRLRQLPHTLLWAQVYRRQNSYEDKELQEWPDRMMMASYMFTMLTGRCGVPLKDDGSPGWLMKRTGYETAWRLSTLHGRAPGFKTWPENRLRLTSDKQDDVKLAAAFVFPPKSKVTVSIESSNAAASVVRQKLIFTPENYNIPQTVTVKTAPDALPSTAFSISFTTTSEDVVYNGLRQSWDYHVNHPPKAEKIKVLVSNAGMSAIQLSGSDEDHEDLTYTLSQQPANGKVSIAGSVAAYQPNPGFTGTDSFSFKTKDFSAFSTAAKVEVTVNERVLFGGNLLQNGDAELFPFSKFAWVQKSGEWIQSAERFHRGKASFYTGDSKAAELYQDVDVSAYQKSINSRQQTFQFSGLFKRNCNPQTRGRMSVVFECRDSAGAILAASEIADIPDDGRFDNKPFVRQSAVIAAVPGTAIIRVRLISEKPLNRKNQCYFDALSLTAIAK